MIPLFKAISNLIKRFRGSLSHFAVQRLGYCINERGKLGIGE